MPMRLIADANAQTTIPGALTSGATSFVCASTANFTSPQNFGNGAGRYTLLDAGNVAWNPAAPFATPFEYGSYTNNNTGTNTLSGLTRGEGGTTAHSFAAGAIIAQGLLAEDLLASVPWKFDDQSGAAASFTIPASGTIPASYLGIAWSGIRITWQARDSSANGADILQMVLNADGTANYDYDTHFVSSSTLQNAPSVGASFLRAGALSTSTSPANSFNGGWVEFPIYASGNRRLYTYQCWRNDNVVTVEWGGGAWRNTAAAITSITMTPGAGSFVAGTFFRTQLIP